MKNIRYIASQSASFLIRYPTVLFLLWAAWLAIPYLLFGASSYCRSHDNADSFLAMLQEPRTVAASGTVGWWNPLVAGGQDTVTSLQLPKLVQWFFIPLPGWLMYGLLMACQRFLAGYFLFRLLRDELALPAWAAIYGGLSYALFSQDGINQGWQGYNLCDGFTLPAMPATIWALARMSLLRSPARWVVAALLGVVVALGWTFPFAIFLFLGYFLWFVAVKPRREIGFWILFALFAIGWLVGQALPIWATLLNAPLSQRSHWDLSAAPFNDERRYLEIAITLLRDNVLPIALLGLGLTLGRFRNRRLIVLAAVIAGVLVYEGSYLYLQNAVIVNLRILSGFNFSRVSYILPFFCATAAAAALPSILGEGEIQFTWRKRWVGNTSMAAPVALLAILLTALQSVEVQKRIIRSMLSGENYSTFYRNPELLALARNHRDDAPFRVATICSPGTHPIHPGMLWSYGLATADGEFQIYPKRYHRFWGELIRGAINTNKYLHDYFLNYGCRIYLFWPEPVEPDAKPVQFRDLYDLELLSLANVRFLVSPFPLSDQRLTLVNAGSDDSSESAQAEADLGKRWPMLRRFLKEGPRPVQLFIYENREVIPRIFLTHRVRLFDEHQQLLSAMAEASRAELASTAFLLRDEAGDLDSGQGPGLDSTVQVKVAQDDRTVVSVSLDKSGILVVTQNYSPFWTARVDGAPSRVIPVDHTFQGVSVAAGKHEVELTYRPPYAFF